jgi:AAA15 family ATPase/GTPase
MTIGEFTVENFCSFKDRYIFSLLATPEKELIEENTFHVKGKQRFLKSTVLYGANASGKSNFFKAISFFRNFAVFSGPRKQIGDIINVDAFQFSKQTQNQPSSFEIVFLYQNRMIKLFAIAMVFLLLWKKFLKSIYLL